MRETGGFVWNILQFDASSGRIGTGYRHILLHAASHVPPVVKRLTCPDRGKTVANGHGTVSPGVAIGRVLARYWYPNHSQVLVPQSQPGTGTPFTARYCTPITPGTGTHIHSQVTGTPITARCCYTAIHILYLFTSNHSQVLVHHSQPGTGSPIRHWYPSLQQIVGLSDSQQVY
ncbi:hypothetical protein FKM82_026320 [Ascaphus truei]